MALQNIFGKQKVGVIFEISPNFYNWGCSPPCHPCSAAPDKRRVSVKNEVWPFYPRLWAIFPLSLG